jgi:glyoxylase-like metal-dependent hydrolase (beta-lactamase superfamily II)
VLVTHIHPDHYGLAARIREVSGAWVGLHPADAALVTDRYQDVDDLLERTSRWVGQTGAPAADLAELRDASMALRRFVVAGQPDVLLGDGDRPDVPGWRLLAVHTPGHTPGHLCFVEERSGAVLTGDHVLPTISPNISRHPQAGPDPLGDYLASLERLRPHGDALVLPGHQRHPAALEPPLGGDHRHHAPGRPRRDRRPPDPPGAPRPPRAGRRLPAALGRQGFAVAELSQER